MCITNAAKSLICEVNYNSAITDDIFIINFSWNGHPPRAGQFFMIKPQRSSVLLGRPISVNEYNGAQKTVKFLIVKAGKGTDELSQMKPGEKAELIGPLGNAWADFLPESVLYSGGKAALISGSAGAAPLAALVAEKPDCHFHFYAGFKNGFHEKRTENDVLGSAILAKKLIVTAEDGRNALSGNITDLFFNPCEYDVIFSCGSISMLKAVKNKILSKGDTPCYVSMEGRMACGVGACLGCTVRTAKGNRRLCSDGPIFNVRELFFDEDR